MADYRLLDTGEVCDPDNVHRMIWYGMCGYWTDNLSKLSEHMGIPCCPSCGGVGFQTTAEQWFDGAFGYEDDGHPRYVEWLQSIQDQCIGSQDYLSSYRNWLNEIPPQDNPNHG